MTKPIKRELVLATAHVEAALAAYLRPYFPEVADIEGVDLELPISAGPGQVKVNLYFRQKDAKAAEAAIEEVVKNDTPAQAKVVDLAKTKKARKR